MLFENRIAKNLRDISEKLLFGAEPLFEKGNDIGFLFLHGFTATPYEGKELTEILHGELKLTVSAPLLPGHGTNPEDLKRIEWRDWTAFALKKYRELKAQCRSVVVCGQSMGGTLALNLAATEPVNGIITLAGAVFLKDWRLYLLPVARHIIPYQYKSKGPDVKNKNLKKTIPSYHKYPVRSIHQLLKLMDHTRQKLPSITAPALLVHSDKDRTINFGNLQYIYDHISSTRKEMLVLENSYHLISLDIEKERVFNRIKSFIQDILMNYKGG